MTDDFLILGGEKLDELSRRLKQAGDRELRKRLLAGIRKTNKPTIRAVKDSARSELPQSGGLADRVARATIGTRTRLTTSEVGVEIKATGKAGSVRRLRALNEGKLRHPLFGNRRYWFVQDVRPGWFAAPIEKDLPQIRAGISEVMQDIANELGKRL